MIFEILSSIYSVTIDKYIHNNNKDGDLKMFRELRELIIEGLHLLLLYGFLCVCAIGVIIIVISKTPQNNSQPLYYAAHPPEPIIQREHSEESLRFVEICSRIDGCPVVKGVCESCEIVIGINNNL